METEEALIYLIAADRLHKPVSSMDGKLSRRKKKVLEDIDVGQSGKFVGERCFARVETENLEVARGVKEGIKAFTERHPKYGAELKALIEEKREERETHLYFGMNEGCRLTRADYMGVMNSLGYSEAAAARLYAPLMGVSRSLAAKSSDDRRILIG
jgi:hypothetical protein